MSYDVKIYVNMQIHCQNISKIQGVDSSWIVNKRRIESVQDLNFRLVNQTYKKKSSSELTNIGHIFNYQKVSTF